QNTYYRIAEYNLNGNIQYSNQFRSSCNGTDAFRLWPNPVHDRLFINIVTGNQSQAILKVYDSKGALVKVQTAIVSPGSNQLKVDMTALANGIYSFVAEWNNGQMKKAVQVRKQ
ncbi:MAG: T9SS type A sorting domain-containing protein, partial [Rhizobacter sp.]|nr:T9SS type A sorting domain-containing protein [Ferruginibacter sp.]